MNWKNRLTRIVKSYRKEFLKLDPEIQNVIREKFYDITLLEPCQIEVLSSKGEVGCIVIHDKKLPDLQIKLLENAKTYNDSEFFRKYDVGEFLRFRADVPLFKNQWIVFWMKNHEAIPISGRPKPEEIVNRLIFEVKEAFSDIFKEKRVSEIERETDELKKGIAQIAEKSIRAELIATTNKIDKTLKEIRRIDEEINSMRTLMGVSQEYQDWRLLVSDVESFKKTPHVTKVLFESEIKRLDQRIDALKEIKFWSKRTIADIILAVIATASTTIAGLLAAGIIHF